MDIKKFLEGIKFSYLQPYEPIPDNWNITKSLNNPIFPEDNVKLRHILKEHILCKYINPKYSLPICGILNKTLSLLIDGNKDDCFIFFGNKIEYFHAAIIGNGQKNCILVNQLVKKSVCRRLFHPNLKSHHIISNNKPLYFLQEYKKYKINKIGLLFVSGSYCKLLKTIENKDLFKKGSIIICTGMNNEEYYNQAMDFLVKERSTILKPEILLFQQTNKDNNHPTYWDGIFCIRFI